jgi:DNA (cytosine-5)-methyltransferase 1
VRPKALDLFCGAGGAAMGLYRAGFDVVGIDIKPQPRYPFPFIQADALRPPVRLEDFDLVWASPPCQAYSALRVMKNRREHAMLIDPVRAMLKGSGQPWVIENVGGAPLRDPLELCGSMFGLESEGFQLRRHRYFEASFFVLGTECQHAPRTVGVYGGKARNIAQEKRHYAKDKETRGAPAGVVLRQGIGRAAMGIDWMNMDELSEAVPPAYSEHIGRYALMALGIEA